MGFIEKFLFFQTLILVPFFIGNRISGRISDPGGLSKKIIRFNLMTLEPIAIFWSIWGLELKSDLVFLPVGGLLLSIFSLFLGKLFLPVFKYTDKRKTAFLINTCLSNHGFTMGGFLCYLILGEQGIGLQFIFISYYMPFIFLFIFPFADISTSKNRSKSEYIRQFMKNPQNLPLYAIIITLIIKTLGIERPGINFPIQYIIYALVGLYYFTLGLTFRPGQIMGMKKENAVMALIKFLIVPLITFTVLSFTHLSPEVKGIILIESFMPAAVYSVITSVLYDLDAGYSSGMFVANTVIFLVVVLPFMLLFKDLFFSF